MTVGLGLSGGVDSAVAALLLRERGYEVVGYTMTLDRADEAASLAAARATAAALGIPLRTIDLAEAWRNGVLDDLRATYRAGRTPNPCVRCNERVKFSLLPETVFADGCDFFATGHYAQIEDARLLRAADRGKDQSYFLYRVRPDVLARTILPLGGMTKDAVRACARAHGLTAADRGDSQDFCGGDALALAEVASEPGDFTDLSGRVLGHHDGCCRYTVGQRKGLGLGGGGTPWYVVSIDATRNAVVVGPRAAAMRKTFAIAETRWHEDPEGLAGLSVKVRSAGEPVGPVTVTRAGADAASVSARDGVFGVAPGQSAVFYRGDTLVGGGILLP